MTSESQLQLDLERKLRVVEPDGVLWHHCARPEYCRGPAGWPDVFAVSEQGLLIYEIKTDDGETSPDQDKWLWTLQHSLGFSHCRIAVRRPQSQREEITSELRWLARNR